MTEQEFQKQVWRPYDQITTADGVKGKVLNVCFTTKSVRAFISGAPEWVRCELIETHTTGKGADGDDAAIIEELHNRIMKQDDEIVRLKNEKAALAEKISKNYLGDLLRAVNLMQQGLQEKKHKMEQIDSGLRQIQAALDNMKNKD
jgi:peptidoglycan hydrolase CwlO-like protein